MGLAETVKLHDYQVVGLNWALSLWRQARGCWHRLVQAPDALPRQGLGGILGDEMGLGKTLQSIALVSHLASAGAVTGPVLVVCPVSLVDHWVSEFRTYAPNVVVWPYVGDAAARAKVQGRVVAHVKAQPKHTWRDPKLPFQVLITTYELLLRDVGFLQRFRWRLLVVDEAHRLRNPTAQLHVMLNRDYHTDKRLLLTGTPVQNNLRELYALLSFASPHVFPADAAPAFCQWFTDASLGPDIVAPQAQQPDAAAVAAGDTTAAAQAHASDLRALLRPFLLRRTKADAALPLPPLSEVVLYTPMSRIQRRYYRWARSLPHLAQAPHALTCAGGWRAQLRAGAQRGGAGLARGGRADQYHQPAAQSMQSPVSVPGRGAGAV